MDANWNPNDFSIEDLVVRMSEKVYLLEIRNYQGAFGSLIILG